jgi:hypothetical protein
VFVVNDAREPGTIRRFDQFCDGRHANPAITYDPLSLVGNHIAIVNGALPMLVADRNPAHCVWCLGNQGGVFAEITVVTRAKRQLDAAGRIDRSLALLFWHVALRSLNSYRRDRQRKSRLKVSPITYHDLTGGLAWRSSIWAPRMRYDDSDP